jgi:cysteinyl-tRNA synthetase
MSKSIGNIVSIKEILSKYSADAMRIFVLSSHYRSPLTYSTEALESAEKGATRLQLVLAAASGDKPDVKLDIEAYRQRFVEAMEDDFNAPQAMAVLFDLARDINRFRDEGYDISAGQKLLRELGSVLGLTFKPLSESVCGAEAYIQVLIETRKELRIAKQYQLADNIRKKLEALGILLEDSASGTNWKAK